MKYLLLLCLLLPSSLKADDAHDNLFSRPVPTFGISYVVCDVSKSFYEKAFGMPKWTAWIFGSVVSSAFITSMRFGEAARLTDGQIKNTIGYNVLGNIGVAIKIGLFE